jgi:hypothetical protein
VQVDGLDETVESPTRLKTPILSFAEFCPFRTPDTISWGEGASKVGCEILHTRGSGMIPISNDVTIVLCLEPIVKSMLVSLSILLMPFMGQPTERS